MSSCLTEASTETPLVVLEEATQATLSLAVVSGFLRDAGELAPVSVIARRVGLRSLFKPRHLALSDSRDCSEEGGSTMLLLLALISGFVGGLAGSAALGFSGFWPPALLSVLGSLFGFGSMALLVVWVRSFWGIAPGIFRARAARLSLDTLVRLKKSTEVQGCPATQELLARIIQERSVPVPPPSLSMQEVLAAPAPALLESHLSEEGEIL